MGLGMLLQDGASNLEENAKQHGNCGYKWAYRDVYRYYGPGVPVKILYMVPKCPCMSHLWVGWLSLKLGLLGF